MGEFIHTPSLLAGLSLAASGLGIFLLLLYNRMQRDHLLDALRLEQAAEKRLFLENQLKELREQQESLGRKNLQLERDNIGLEALVHETRTIAGERQRLFAQVKEQMEEDFQNLSRKVLSEQGQQLQQQHASGLENVLLPMREQLNGFRQRIEDVYERESRDRIGLVKEIEQLKNLNERISRDAVELTQALQGDNKLQGQWGEMVLERLLEDSGLRRGREYDCQVSHRDEQGRRKQPDVIIHLPEKRDVIIDSKVSLKSYLAACQSGDPQTRQGHLDEHLASLGNHIRGLSKKQYQDLPGLVTVDFVLLFIPIEGAFQAAVTVQPDFLSRAMRKGVVISSPSTLLAILRTIHHLWRLDDQSRNSITIAREGGKLYDKFVGFVDAFNEVGQRLNQAQQSWQLAEKRLASGRGNLIDRAEKLRELGVQPGKELPVQEKSESGHS